MSSIIVTNNKYVYDKYKDLIEVDFKENFTYMQILEYVRDKIHQGHQLLTHPLSGSVKPNETPYKTVMISKNKGNLDNTGLLIIEDAIATVKKFLSNRPTPNWPENILDDFRVIDLSLMENVIDKLGHK